MYLAHISDDKLREQTIREHLEGVAKLIAEISAYFESVERG